MTTVRTDTFFVIQTYNRPYYVENFATCAAVQVGWERIYIADANSTNRELLEILKRLQNHGCHVAWQSEHHWGDWCKNRGWEWAIERGAEYVFLAEDGVLPALNLASETADLFEAHPSFWVVAPVMSNTPRLDPCSAFEPGPVPSGRIADGETDERARVFVAAEALERMKIIGRYAAKRSPRWRVVNHVDSVMFCVRRSCWEAVGLLDEAFGHGSSTDSDYFYRVATAGGEIVIDERTYADHWRDAFDFGTPREVWPSLSGPQLGRKYGGMVPDIPYLPREGDD